MTNDTRSPAAKARDEFLASKEGCKLCHGTTSGENLRNRIEAAFLFGFEAGMIEAGENLAKALKRCL